MNIFGKLAFKKVLIYGGITAGALLGAVLLSKSTNKEEDIQIETENKETEEIIDVEESEA